MEQDLRPILPKSDVTTHTLLNEKLFNTQLQSDSTSWFQWKQVSMVFVAVKVLFSIRVTVSTYMREQTVKMVVVLARAS